jgi:carbonic anhydrase
MKIELQDYTSTHSIDHAINTLKRGNQRFVDNIRINRNFHHEIEATKQAQEPFAVIISCMDSRTSPEHIFDLGIGDVFTIRIAGNIVTPEIIGSVEYACKAIGAEVVMILGHKGCGAIKGAMDKVDFGFLPTITKMIKVCSKLNVDEITIQNVETGIHTLTNQSPILKTLMENKKSLVVFMTYQPVQCRLWRS